MGSGGDGGGGGGAACKILACAPSEAAADVLALRLVELCRVHAGAKHETRRFHLPGNRFTMLRLNAYTRTVAEVSNLTLLNFCEINDNGVFKFSVDRFAYKVDATQALRISDFDVIVCTCETSYLLKCEKIIIIL